MTMPPPTRDDWRLIPDAVIAQDDRQTQAQEWGTQARAEIAQQWGDMARAEVATPPSDSLTNPLGTGNAGGTTEFSSPSAPSPVTPPTSPAPALPAPSDPPRFNTATVTPPTPDAPAPSSFAPVTPTTVDIGVGKRAGNIAVNQPDVVGQIGDIALKAGLSDEGAKVAQAIVVTEGGLTGAVGDVKGGGSYGPFQFYWQGQLKNFARDKGMSLDTAAEYARTHPLEAADWALNGGYLGQTILRGQQMGLHGAALATYAQQHGQVSDSPERAGRNYDALFGNGAPAIAPGPQVSPGLPGDTATGPRPPAPAPGGRDFTTAVQQAKDAVSGAASGAAQTASDVVSGATQAVAKPFSDLVNEARLALGPQALTASMQPTPSDTLTTPLGTGNAATSAPAGSTPAIGSLAPPPPQPNAVLPALGQAKDALLQGDVQGAGNALGQAREAVATSAVGPVLGALRGPELLTDQEIIARASPEELSMAQRFGATDQHSTAEILRGLSEAHAAAMTHTGEGINPVPVSAFERVANLRPDDIKAALDAGDVSPLSRDFLFTVQPSVPEGALIPQGRGVRLDDPRPATWLTEGGPLGGRTGRVLAIDRSQLDPSLLEQAPNGYPVYRGIIPANAIRDLGDVGTNQSLLERFQQSVRGATVQGNPFSPPSRVNPGVPLGRQARRALELTNGDVSAATTNLERLTAQMPGDTELQNALTELRAMSAAPPPSRAPSPVSATEPLPPTAARSPVAAPELPTAPVAPTAPAAAATAASPEVARLRLQDFPEWLHQDLTDAATNSNFHVDARRGVIPLEQQAQMGADLAENSNLDALIRQGKAGKAYNTEQIRAMKTLLVSQAQKVNDASRVVADATAKGEATDIGMARALAEGEKLQALQSVYEGARAEWGRAGQAWQAPANVMSLSPSEATARIFNKIGGRDNALKAITEYNRLVQSGATPFEMANFWATVEKPPAGFQDWFTAIRYNSMLSGPRTFEVNAVGNALEVPWRLARDTGASLVRGRPEEIAPEVAGIWGGLSTANRKFMEVMSNGITSEKALAGDVPQGLAPRVSNPVGKAAATALDLPGKMLGAADEWAKAIAYSMALGRRAGVQASREGLRGNAWNQRVGDILANPAASREGQAMMKEATAIADRMTYKGDMGSLGTALSGISKVPYLGNIILPFMRTVYHITARGVDRSPLGLVGTAADVARGQYGKTIGEVRQSLGAAQGPAKGVAPLGERLGDNLVGSAIALAFYQKALDGNISGAGPDDTEKKGMLRAEGWQPYSIKLGDRWVSYANWGPVAIPLAGAAAAAESQNYRKPGADSGAIFADAARRTAQLVTEQTYLQSIGAVWKGLNEPDKYGAQFVGQFVTSMIPFGSALNTLGQATDSVQRQPNKKDLGQFMAQSTEARLPGLRQNVPVQQDQLGRPTPNDASGLAALSPLRSSMIRNNAVLQEMLRNGADVPEPATDYRNIPLKPDEQRQFNELAGRYIEQNVQGLMKDREYQKYDVSDKQRALQRSVDFARKQAGGEVIGQLTDAEINKRLSEARAKKVPVPILP